MSQPSSAIEVIQSLLWVQRQSTKRDSRLLIVALMMPVIVIILVGIVFQSNGKAPLAIINNDKNAISNQIVNYLNESNLVKLKFYNSQGQLKDDVLRGRATAGVEFEKIKGSNLVGIKLIVPSRQVTEVSSINSLNFAISTESARFEVLNAPKGSKPSESLQTFDKKLNAALEQYARSRNKALSPYSYTTPSNIVLFSFLTVFGASSAIVAKRKNGIYKRILAAPVRVWTITVAELVGNFSLSLVQGVLLSVLGYFLFGVRFGSYVATFVLLVLLALAASSLGTLLGTRAKSVDQNITLGIVLSLAMGMLGGCMWPLSIVGPVMREIGHVTPQAWAMDAFTGLIYNHANIVSIFPDLVILAIFGIVGVLLASFSLLNELKIGMGAS